MSWALKIFLFNLATEKLPPGSTIALDVLL
jgi:hypothetical protein